MTLLIRRIESCFIFYYVVVIVFVFLFLSADIIAVWRCIVWFSFSKLWIFVSLLFFFFLYIYIALMGCYVEQLFFIFRYNGMLC